MLPASSLFKIFEYFSLGKSRYRLRTRVNTQAPEDVLEMEANGVLTHTEYPGNLSICLAVTCPTQTFSFTHGQFLQRITVQNDIIRQDWPHGLERLKKVDRAHVDIMTCGLEMVTGLWTFAPQIDGNTF